MTLQRPPRLGVWSRTTRYLHPIGRHRNSQDGAMSLRSATVVATGRAGAPQEREVRASRGVPGCRQGVAERASGAAPPWRVEPVDGGKQVLALEEVLVDRSRGYAWGTARSHIHGSASRQTTSCRANRPAAIRPPTPTASRRWRPSPSRPCASGRMGVQGSRSLSRYRGRWASGG